VSYGIFHERRGKIMALIPSKARARIAALNFAAAAGCAAVLLGLEPDCALAATYTQSGITKIPAVFSPLWRKFRATIPDAVEAAYRRGDLFDKRRKLMDAWAAYCAKVETDAGKVVALARARTPR
jgi:hypothetical protein